MIPRYPDRQGWIEITFATATMEAERESVAFSFIYPGSNAVGAFNVAKILLGSHEKTGKSWACLYDVTNRKAIAEISFAIRAYPAIVDFGTIGNVPEEEAIVEIRVKSQEGKLSVSSLSLRF